MSSLFHSNLTSLPLIQRGKVRDIYAIDEQRLLIVATDRLSAFDVVLPTPIPQKGKILTTLSTFWFTFSQKLISNHLITDLTLAEVLSEVDDIKQVSGRSVIVRKLQPLPVEAIVRGYLVGSGWKDYQQTGEVCGIPLPTGLRQAEILPHPIYTPSSKAAAGQHDENIDFEHTVQLVGKELATQVRDVSLELYTQASAYARKRGIIIADTKFEFGVDETGKLILIDEVLTPDSSRFWPVDEYQIGISPPSFDKQFVRDYLETLVWNKQAPGPELPDDIVKKTTEKYQEALTRLTQ